MEMTHLKTPDGSDAGSALYTAAPELFLADADGADDPDACYHHTVHCLPRYKLYGGHASTSRRRSTISSYGALDCSQKPLQCFFKCVTMVQEKEGSRMPPVELRVKLLEMSENPLSLLYIAFRQCYASRWAGDMWEEDGSDERKAAFIREVMHTWT